MQLRPQQIVGLVAVIFFGGMLIWQLTQPKRDPFSVPGAMPLNTSAYDEKVIKEGFGPSETPPQVIAPPDAPAAPAATPISDPLAVGSDDAKDDLYCSGVIFAAHRASADAVSADARKRRDRVIALAERGTGKLVAAGVADSTQTAAIADAHAEKAQQDYAAGTPRIPLNDCETRADAK